MVNEQNYYICPHQSSKQTKMKIYKKYQKSVNEFMKRTLEKYGDKIDSIILFGSEIVKITEEEAESIVEDANKFLEQIKAAIGKTLEKLITCQ